MPCGNGAAGNWYIGNVLGNVDGNGYCDTLGGGGKVKPPYNDDGYSYYGNVAGGNRDDNS